MIQHVQHHQFHRNTPNIPADGEKALWRAVITQALMDASSQSKKTELQYEKSQSLCWLTSFTEDFRTVCEFADYDPHYVRENSLSALERNCQWRAPSTANSKPPQPPTRPTTSTTRANRAYGALTTQPHIDILA